MANRAMVFGTLTPVTKHGMRNRVPVWYEADMAIKELLQEELANSLRMERDYKRAAAALPRGCLVRKAVAGRAYYYLVGREGGRVRFRYLGKAVDEKEQARYAEAKRLRAQYRRLQADVRRQVRFLRKALCAKQAV